MNIWFWFWTQGRRKSHSTQTSKRLGRDSVLPGENFLPKIQAPPPSQLEKLFEYSGESLEKFISDFHKLPGNRQNLRRKINQQKETNKKAKKAAIAIQRWWRKNRKAKKYVQNPDGVSLRKIKVRPIRTKVIENKPKIKQILIPVDSPVSPRLASTSFIER